MHIMDILLMLVFSMKSIQPQTFNAIDINYFLKELIHYCSLFAWQGTKLHVSPSSRLSLIRLPQFNYQILLKDFSTDVISRRCYLV